MNDRPFLPDWHEIISQLRLEAGRIMEDTADDLAMALSSDRDASRTELNEELSAAADIQALLAAAQVLHRRCLHAANQD